MTLYIVQIIIHNSAWNKYFACAGHRVRQSALPGGHSQFVTVTNFYENLNNWKTLLTLNNTGGVVSADIVLTLIALPIDYSMW